MGRIEQTVDPVDQVVHVAKRARLPAIPVDGERFALQCLNAEVRYDTAIAPPHSGPIRVEYAHDSSIDSVVAVVGHRHRFGEPLRLIVHAAGTHGVHMPPVIFSLRMLQGVTIDLTRAG